MNYLVISTPFGDLTMIASEATRRAAEGCCYPTREEPIPDEVIAGAKADLAATLAAWAAEVAP